MIDYTKYLNKAFKWATGIAHLAQDSPSPCLTEMYRFAIIIGEISGGEVKQVISISTLSIQNQIQVELVALSKLVDPCWPALIKTDRGISLSNL